MQYKVVGPPFSRHSWYLAPHSLSPTLGYSIFSTVPLASASKSPSPFPLGTYPQDQKSLSRRNIHARANNSESRRLRPFLAHTTSTPTC